MGIQACSQPEGRRFLSAPRNDLGGEQRDWGLAWRGPERSVVCADSSAELSFTTESAAAFEADAPPPFGMRLYVPLRFGGTMLLVGLGSGTMLFSPWAWRVRELERSTLAYLADSHLPAVGFVTLYLSGREKSGGRLVFSKGITGGNSNGDAVGSC
jgi:hypothetical protein